MRQSYVHSEKKTTKIGRTSLQETGVSRKMGAKLRAPIMREDESFSAK